MVAFKSVTSQLSLEACALQKPAQSRSLDGRSVQSNSKRWTESTLHRIKNWIMKFSSFMKPGARQKVADTQPEKTTEKQSILVSKEVAKEILKLIEEKDAERIRDYLSKFTFVSETDMLFKSENVLRAQHLLGKLIEQLTGERRDVNLTDEHLKDANIKRALESVKKEKERIEQFFIRVRH